MKPPIFPSVYSSAAFSSKRRISSISSNMLTNCSRLRPANATCRTAIAPISFCFIGGLCRQIRGGKTRVITYCVRLICQPYAIRIFRAGAFQAGRGISASSAICQPGCPRGKQVAPSQPFAFFYRTIALSLWFSLYCIPKRKRQEVKRAAIRQGGLANHAARSFFTCQPPSPGVPMKPANGITRPPDLSGSVSRAYSMSQTTTAQRRAPDHLEEERAMTYVITQPCIGLKDASCVDVCPVDCIHAAEEDEQFFINPEECIDCGACEPVCPVNAIFEEGSVPKKWKPFIQVNADYFLRQRQAKK